MQKNIMAFYENVFEETLREAGVTPLRTPSILGGVMSKPRTFILADIYVGCCKTIIRINSGPDDWRNVS